MTILAVLDAPELGELLAHLDEQLGFGFEQPGQPSGQDTGLPVLGHPVGGADERKARVAGLDYVLARS